MPKNNGAIRKQVRREQARLRQPAPYLDRLLRLAREDPDPIDEEVNDDG